MSLLARPTITLLSGTVVAQLIALMVSPLLTRQFGPQDFGALALYTALLGAFTVVASGRYELAILLPSDDEQALQLAALSMLLALLFALLLSGVFYALDIAQLDLFEWPASRAWRGLLPWACFCAVGYAALGAWANRKAHYRLIAAHRVLHSIAVALASVALGFWGGFEHGLVWGSFLGLLLAFVSLMCFAWPALAAAYRALSLSALHQIAKQHQAFPRLNLPHALLDSLQSVALLAVIGAAWGAASLGLYAFALRVVRTPFAMVGSAMGQVFQQQFASAFNQRQPLRPLVLALLRKQMPCLLLLVGVGVVAPWVFGGVFGAAWREAGNFAQTLTPWMALSFLVSPLAQIPQVMGRQGAALMWGLGYQASMLLPVLAAWALEWGVRPGLLAQSVCASLLLGAYGFWLWRLTSEGNCLESD